MKQNKIKRSVSIFTVFVITLSSVTLFVTAGASALFLSGYNRALTRNAYTYTEQAVAQTASAINTYSAEMQNSIDLVTSGISSENDRTQVDSYLDAMTRAREDLIAVFVYDSAGRLLSRSADGRVFKQNESGSLPAGSELLGIGTGYYISAPHVQSAFLEDYPWVVTIAKRQTVAGYGGEVIIALDFRFSSIASYIDKVGIGGHGYCYVMDQNGEIVYHPQQQLLFLGLKDEPAPGADLSDGTRTLGGNDTICSVKTLENGRWKIVGVSYLSELVRGEVRNVAAAVLGIALAVVVIILAFIYLYSKKVTDPVRELCAAMEEFEKNAADFEYSRSFQIREIDLLSQSFSHMVGRIKLLMEQIKNEEISLRKTELKALQAQINPHFLYNTLDSIQWMCEQGKMQDAVKMVGALAKLFRISINRGYEFVTVEDELNHAKSYLIIQSYRYKNQFSYRFEVEGQVLQYLCNKVTLQPIIENAIYHGIGRMVDEGELVITAREDGTDIVFSVQDNGVGMTEEQCCNILRKDAPGSSGIGLKNVNDRLKIYFGEPYGITIHSVPDEGTTVFVRFPKKEDNQREL